MTQGTNKKKSTVWIILTIILLIAAIVLGVLYAQTNNTLKTTQDTLVTTETELTITKDTLAITEAELTTTKDTLAITEAELTTTKDTLATTETELASTKDTLATTEAELTATKDTLAITEAELTTTKDTLAAVETELTATKDTLATVETELTATKKALATVETELTATKEVLAAANTEPTTVEVQTDAPAQNDDAKNVTYVEYNGFHVPILPGWNEHRSDEDYEYYYYDGNDFLMLCTADLSDFGYDINDSPLMLGVYERSVLSTVAEEINGSAPNYDDYIEFDTEDGSGIYISVPFLGNDSHLLCFHSNRKPDTLLTASFLSLTSNSVGSDLFATIMDGIGIVKPDDAPALTPAPASAGPDYTETECEAALNRGENLVGKTVEFVANTVKPDSAFGFNLWSGEHLNFIAPEPFDAVEGGTYTAKIREVQTVLGSWIIYCDYIN